MSFLAPSTLTGALMLGACLSSLPAAPPNPASPPIKYDETTTGVRFGTWGETTATPAPVFFILASTIEETLGTAYFRQAGNALAERGFICVSVDLPCHGAQLRASERPGLDGWRDRADQHENFVTTSNQRLREVLDHLIADGTADPERITAGGTSRGGFLALQFAAADPRVSSVVAFAPVTDLTALREFHGTEDNPFVQSLSIIHQSPAFDARPVWVVIGDRDERVSTAAAISFVRAITASALDRGLNPQAELHVLPEPKGHTTPAGAPEQAAAWILSHLQP